MAPRNGLTACTAAMIFTSACSLARVNAWQAGASFRSSRNPNLVDDVNSVDCKQNEGHIQNKATNRDR